MTGIIIVDKPAGWTSHDVVAKLRGALRIKRVGHGGTLDPMATGVLPVFVGRATRAASVCENAEKEYIAGLRLGVVTDTQDITGTVISQRDATVCREDLAAVLPEFLGAQTQTVPMYSAVKIGGKKLYEIARRGETVERPRREIFVPEIELLEGEDFTLRVVCSKGTYIRTLCHDIGEKLGAGGCMSSLRRTRAGAFTIDMAHTLDEVLAAVSSGELDRVMRPIDTIFADLFAITLDPADTRKLSNGAPCDVTAADGKYRVYGPDGAFLALGEVCDGTLRVIKNFSEQ